MARLPEGFRHATVTCVVAIVLVAGAQPIAWASPATYVTDDCYHVRVRPDSIMFACADAGYTVTRLDWSTWRARTAVGRGVFHLNDCDPDCADGTYHRRRGQITMSGRRWCPDIDKYVFRRARVEYDHPLLDRSTTRFPLFCPL